MFRGFRQYIIEYRVASELMVGSTYGRGTKGIDPSQYIETAADVQSADHYEKSKSSSIL